MDLCNHLRMPELKRFLNTQSDKPWIFYFRAVIRRHYFKDVYPIALKALQLGDTRVVPFLVDEYLTLWRMQNFYIPLHHFTTVIQLLEQHNKDGSLNNPLCTTYSVFSMRLVNPEKKAQSKQKALHYLLNFLDPRAEIDKFFIRFLVDILYYLRIIDERLLFLEVRMTSKEKYNALEYLMHIYHTYPHSFSGDITPIINWIKKFADAHYPAAAFHYAILLNKKTNPSEIKYYLLQALNGGYFKAIDELYSLGEECPRIMPPQEVVDLAIPGARKRNNYCIFLLSDIFIYNSKLNQSIEKIWIIQLAICAQPDFNDLYNSIVKKSQYPENLPIRCALVFIYALRNQNIIKAKKEFLEIAAVDFSILEKYMRTGKELGYCDNICENIFNQFSALQPVENSAQSSHGYRLRKRH